MKTVNIREVSLDEIRDLPIHPIADIFPMLAVNSTEREAGKADKQTITLSELADSILENGLQEPIVLFNREDEGGNVVTWLLDGRNRRAACIKANVETVLVEDFEGTEEEAEIYVLNLNIDRRDLTPGQRAFAAAKYWEMEAEKSAARKAVGWKRREEDLPSNLTEDGSWGNETREVLARRFRVSNSYVTKAHKELEDIAKTYAKAEELQEKAAELEAVEQAAQVKLDEAKSVGDTEAIREAAIEINQAALKKVEAREQATEVTQKAASQSRKVERVQRGESFNSVYGEQKQKTQAEDPVAQLRTRINSGFTNLKAAVEELAKVSGQGEDDWNFVGRKIDDFIRAMESAFGMEV